MATFDEMPRLPTYLWRQPRAKEWPVLLATSWTVLRKSKLCCAISAMNLLSCTTWESAQALPSSTPQQARAEGEHRANQLTGGRHELSSPKAALVVHYSPQPGHNPCEDVQLQDLKPGTLGSLEALREVLEHLKLVLLSCPGEYPPKHEQALVYEGEVP